MVASRVWQLLAVAATFFFFCLSSAAAEYNASGSIAAPSPLQGREILVFSHMANHPRAVDWALGQGANAIEIDLQFNGAGVPYEFRHSGICDCSCLCPIGSMCSHSSICRQLWDATGSHCNARVDAIEMFQHLATKRASLVVIYLDSKIDSMPSNLLATAGRNVVRMAIDQTFARGYAGKLIVGCPTIKQVEYLRAAVATARSYAGSKFADRIFFTIDGEQNDVTPTLNTLVHNLDGARNRVYSTGITTCVPKDFEDSVSLGAYNTRLGVLGGSFIWSIDKEDSMRDYINAGAHGVLSNYPGRLRGVVDRMGLRVATPGSSNLPMIPTSDQVISSVGGNCDCDYHSGGCRISRVAPAGLACRCKYSFLWTCSGKVDLCSDPLAPLCRHPDASLASCRLGRGDCGGYK